MSHAGGVSIPPVIFGWLNVCRRQVRPNPCPERRDRNCQCGCGIGWLSESYGKVLSQTTTGEKMEIDILWLLGFAGAEALAAWLYLRKNVHKVRVLVDTVDDALYDDKVTEAEYRDIWEQFKRLLGWKR